MMIALNPLSQPTYLMGDFRAFYCGGSVIAHGANPYLEEPLRTCEAKAGPPLEPAFLHTIAVPVPLPPYALLSFVPLSSLPFPIAASLYGALLMIAMSMAVALFSRVTAVSSVWLNIAFAGITATVTYYIGQPVPFAFLALAATAALIRKESWTAASACAVASTIEPHIALPVLVAMVLTFPRTRLPILGYGLLLAIASVIAVGWHTNVLYLRAVLPAHALANAYEWQFSLTSVLTSLGVKAPTAIHAGAIMYIGMVTSGIVVAYRFFKKNSDRAAMILIPPAFAVFGGVHIHFQQIAITFPALLYIYVRYPSVRMMSAAGITLAMIPWNVMSSSLLTGFTPLLVGAFARLTMGTRRGLLLTAVSAAIAISVLLLILSGFGPPPAHFVEHAVSPNALAEKSWGQFSHGALQRPSLLMQWLRLPTLLGLAMGLLALTRAGFESAPLAIDRMTLAPTAVGTE